MQQEAQVYVFLSPAMETLLGENGKRLLSAKIKTAAERRIKGYIPQAIQVVPSFAIQPMAGNVIIGYVSFRLFQGVSPELIKGPIVDASQSAIAEVVSSPTNEVAVIISLGGTFTIYP